MIIHKISDTIVFNALKSIRYGFIEIIKFDGSILKFGDKEDQLKVKVIIKHPSFTYNLIKSGSIGLAESYMSGYFETNNLSDLIELTAKNIKIIHKFSGVLDLPAINYFKNKIKLGFYY